MFFCFPDFFHQQLAKLLGCMRCKDLEEVNRPFRRSFVEITKIIATFVTRCSFLHVSKTKLLVVDVVLPFACS